MFCFAKQFALLLTNGWNNKRTEAKTVKLPKGQTNNNLVICKKRHFTTNRFIKQQKKNDTLAKSIQYDYSTKIKLSILKQI